ncbi:5'/3'-nucleotidase SurE [Actinokineospora spheciospongiae]|uniref:5'/3'-nucleotidase SurE n=1 Tax=Actinokineospora spheciospongiae TaxID=909613 RepID=UPI0005580EFB|nr:5'/3'-nucleotidase SurE [Actinokineospora spheciospongiae]
MSPRVLVTNDDGIDSPGLLALARCAVDLGWTTLVAAPAAEASGTSAGLTAATDDRTFAVERRTLDGLPGAPAYAVAAHPGLIALTACHGGFGDRPDLVLSGINRGANIGRAVLHSGTVGAALTGSINGARALAVSLDVPLDPTAPPNWGTAASVVAGLLPLLASLEVGAVLNVNVPDVPADRLLPARWARLASYGRVRSKVTQVDDGTIEVGNVVVDGDLEPGTDADLLGRGHVTVTALRSVHEDDALMDGELPG